MGADHINSSLFQNMWVRRTKEQFHKAAVRNVKIAVQGSAISFLIFTVIYYYRLSSRNPNHHPPFAILLSSVCLALIIVLFSTSVTILDEWLHLNLIPSLGIPNSRDMLCMKCWYVQDYSVKLVCSKCGGNCEDARGWTWIDDVETGAAKAPTRDVIEKG
jgi:hypothetical protein